MLESLPLRALQHEILIRTGWIVNRKKVRRIMRKLGLEAIVPWKNTSKPHPDHKKYPYLLRGVRICRVDQVWSTDITYIQTRNGYCYLVAVVDWHSRKVLAWRMSNTLDSSFCIDALEDALSRFGCPEIFNTDQGSQFTSDAFTGVLMNRTGKIGDRFTLVPIPPWLRPDPENNSFHIHPVEYSLDSPLSSFC